VSSKPETKKAVEEAREELQHADMEKFGRALRALVKIPASDLKTKKRKK
jgi:hypothetical protein